MADLMVGSKVEIVVEMMVVLWDVKLEKMGSLMADCWGDIEVAKWADNSELK